MSTQSLERKAEELAEFYCSGTCKCGHGRGQHDYPMGRCMKHGCTCTELRVIEPQGRAA